MYNYYYPYNYRFNNIRHGFKNINFKSILDGTQKTLSIINQAIPVIYQIKPLINNAKTAFKVINAIKEEDPIKSEDIKETKKVEPHKNNSPTYFL